jgi:hypothetical protein
MKSLAQIEPRTPISSAPFSITQPGSYYLTTNVTVNAGDAITINANNVTLDLNGFTISSTQPSALTGTAILLAGGNAIGANSGITILNGHIQSGVTNEAGVYGGSGFLNGINYTGQQPANTRVAGVSVAGCQSTGIYLNFAQATVVENCTVQTVGGSGILAANVSHCSAMDCGFTAIYATTASDCFSVSTGGGYGLYAINANNCYAYCTGNGMGIDADSASNCKGLAFGAGAALNATTANNCYGQNFSTGVGLNAIVATSCYGSSLSGTGLSAINANNCNGTSSIGIGLNASETATGCSGHSSGNTYGLSANNANNCVGVSSGDVGLFATETAFGCSGRSSGATYGLSAPVATCCYGSCSGGIGLRAQRVALNCYGLGYGYGLFCDVAIGCEGAGGISQGIAAAIANSCMTSGGNGGIGHPYNMP